MVISRIFFCADQFFTFCDVDERGYCQKFKKPYHKNSKVVMDNHPFIIMAKEKKKVISAYFRNIFPVMWNQFHKKFVKLISRKKLFY